MPKKILPPAEQPNISKAELSENIGFFAEISNRGKLMQYNPAEIQERISWYFQKCQEHNVRPGIEGLGLALGVTRQSIWEWSHEQSERGEIIRQAKQLMISLVENWGLSGKLNPATHCFIMKNWAGYQDSVQIEAVAIKPEPYNSPEEIQRIIEQDIPID